MTIYYDECLRSTGVDVIVYKHKKEDKELWNFAYKLFKCAMINSRDVLSFLIKEVDLIPTNTYFYNLKTSNDYIEYYN